MSAARAIPPVEELAQTITITYANNALTVSPSGAIVTLGEQVTFTNGSTQTSITITFNPNPLGPPLGPGPTLFSNMTLGPGAFQTQTAPNSDGSVNYNVTVNGAPYGPYVIQVGPNGSMVVQLSTSASGTVYSPDHVAIPLRSATGSGGLSIQPSGFTIAWDTTDPLSPGLQSSGGGSQVGPNILSGNYGYSASPASPPPADTRVLGGGTGGKVIIRS